MIENVFPHILHIAIVGIDGIAILKNETLSVFFPSTIFHKLLIRVRFPVEIQ